VVDEVPVGALYWHRQWCVCSGSGSGTGLVMGAGRVIRAEQSRAEQSRAELLGERGAWSMEHGAQSRGGGGTRMRGTVMCKPGAGDGPLGIALGLASTP
jgi:hypothetical protein